MSQLAEDDMAFLNLILLLGTMASQRLDSLAECSPEMREKLLPKARENINMLTSLKKRTQGRLTTEEGKVIETLLNSLQIRYVRALGLRSDWTA